MHQPIDRPRPDHGKLCYFKSIELAESRRRWKRAAIGLAIAHALSFTAAVIALAACST